MFYLSMRVYAAIGAFIFTLVAVLHLSRLIGQWEMILGGWHAPMWFSVVGLFVAAFLAFEGYHFALPHGFHSTHAKMPSG